MKNTDDLSTPIKKNGYCDMIYDKYREEWMNKYPTIHDLEIMAKKRIPEVAYAYMQTGTSHERLLQRNIDDLQDVHITPRFAKGELSVNLETELFGQKYSAPFGTAPIGLMGLMWPKAETIVAEMADHYGIPSGLSTVATETPETVGPYAGDMGWFQLYTPRDPELRRLFLKRAKDAGYKVLMITVDIPLPSRRERTKRAGLTMPLKMGPKMIWDGMTHPAWTIATLKRGLPRLRMVESHAEFKTMMSVGKFVQGQLGGNLSWDICAQIKEEWDGPVLVKGILDTRDAEEARSIGLDGVVVSNHGGRQFDGAPSPIKVLPEIVEAVGDDMKIVFDSGIRSGLDIMRAIWLGADFVLCGRAYLYGLAALGRLGAYHVTELLMLQLQNNMHQIGASSLEQLKRQEL